MRLMIAATLLSMSAMAQALADASPARTLAGRVAGVPRTCIPPLAADTGGNLFASGDILYRGRGSTIYLNHPSGCPKLTPNRAIVSTHPTGNQCRGDIIDVVEPVSGISYGGCALGDFIPYAKPGR